MSRNSEVNVKAFLEERLEAGKRINPENSDLFRRHAMVIDPYGILNDIPDEYKCIGKTWFVYSPDEGEFYVGDVPDEVIESIQKRTIGADLTYSEDLGF